MTGLARTGSSKGTDSARPARTGGVQVTLDVGVPSAGAQLAAPDGLRIRLGLLAALALTGDASKGGDVLPRLNTLSRRSADTFRALNKGAHAAHDGDLWLLIADAKDLVAKIRAMLP